MPEPTTRVSTFVIAPDFFTPVNDPATLDFLPKTPSQGLYACSWQWIGSVSKLHVSQFGYLENYVKS